MHVSMPQRQLEILGRPATPPPAPAARWRGAALSMTTFGLSHDELALRTTVSGMLSTCFSTSATVKAECGGKTNSSVRPQSAPLATAPPASARL